MEYILPFLPEKIKNLPIHMDFDGQKRAERYFQIIIILFAVVGFVWGYITQQFSQTLYILFAGVTVSALLTLIPWSIYRRKPLQWQAVLDQASKGASQQGSANMTQLKTKKKKLKD